jgi:hypothetical protein
MKYSIFYPQTKDIVEYTIIVLRTLIKFYGHQEVDPIDADILLLSVCDVTQICFVERIRLQYPDKKICVGGHAAVYYKLFSLFSDYINIGQGFDFFKCKSEDEIKELPGVYHKDKFELLIPSTFIDWAIVPCSNVTTGAWYYWGAIGCKNKCKYCLTSWTNPHQQNDPLRIESVRRKIKNVTIVTNDSDSVGKRMTQSIMLRDFLIADLKKYAVYRIGVEFATEENRRKYGKFFTNDDFYFTIKKAIRYGVRLKLFFISGIDTYKNWESLFDGIAQVYIKGRFDLKFTNICYEMFTPIKKERYNINIDNMFNTQKSKKFTLKYKTYIWPLHECSCSLEATTLKKNILIYTTCKQEYEIFKSIKYQEDKNILYEVLMKNNFFENDYSDTVKIDHGKILCP